MMRHVHTDPTSATTIKPQRRVARTGLYIEKFRNPYPPGHPNHGVHMYNVVRPNRQAVVRGEDAAIRTAVTHFRVNKNRNPRARYNQGGYYKNTGASNVNLEGTARNGNRYNIHMDYNQNGAAPHTTSDRQPTRYPTQLMNANGIPSAQGSSIHVVK